MSNRLTFSLASFILIFALAFATMPAMAETGGPTVMFEEYSGVENPAADPSTQTAATAQHTQERGDFRLKVTFSEPVSGVTADDFSSLLAGPNTGFGTPTALSTLTGVWTSADTTSSTEYVLTVLAAAPPATDTRVYVTIAADVANRISDNRGNVAGRSEIYTLPALIPATEATVNLEAPMGTATPGTYTVNAVFTPPDTATSVLALSTAFDDTRIVVDPETAAAVTVGTNVDATAAPWTVTYPITVVLTHGVNTVDISIDPSYIAGSNTVTVSALKMLDTPTGLAAVPNDNRTITLTWTAVANADSYTITQTGATAADGATIPNAMSPHTTPALAVGDYSFTIMAVDDDGTHTNSAASAAVTATVSGIAPTAAVTLSAINEDETFRVIVSFTKAGADEAPVPMDLNEDHIKVTTDAAGMMDAVIADPMVTMLRGMGQFSVTVDYSTSALPLYVSLIEKVEADATATPPVEAVDGVDVSNVTYGTDPTATALMVGEAPVTNTAPVFSADADTSISGVVGEAIDAADVSATDADGDTLTYSWDVDEAALGLALGQDGMITGTPLKAHTMDHIVTVTDGIASAMHTIAVSIGETGTPENTPPVVTITTTTPGDSQMGSFAVAYTVTDTEDDADAEDDAETTVAATLNADAPTGYTVDRSTTDDDTAGTVTIMQAKGSAAANITVTITATDSDGATDSATLSVIFREYPADPPDVTPPTVIVTAPTVPDASGNLVFTFTFSEPINADTFTTSDIQGEDYIVTVAPALVATDTTMRTWTAAVRATGVDDVTIVVNAGAVEDLAGNTNAVGAFATYKPATPTVDTTPPTVTVSASPNPINCDTGSTLSFAFSEALGAKEAVAASELTVSAGWKAMADGGAIKIVPMGDGSEIGVTTVSVSVNAGAVKDEAGNANAASAKATVFTVGPVLTIPAGGYIVVIRPEHMYTTHLRDPLYIGSTGVRAPMVDIQTWECMPDLTIFFGRSVPAIGGGAIVVKQADGPMGHTGTAIGKGSVGLSEIMWASDEGVAHGGISSGGRSNIDQTREQWIELHNRNSTAVKVTLFARPTNSALTTETDELDRVSNYNINNVWAAPGQSGNSEFGIDFVSMQRGKHDNKGLAPNAAEGYAHGHWNGTHANRWSASTISYLTRRSGLGNTGQIAADNLLYDFLGTPGRNNKPGISTPILRTNVPKNTIVFNEIANRRDQTLEWIELKNVSDKEVNLRKYQISLATATGTDHVFYNFPDNDNIKLAAGELLLLLDTDPRDNDAHPIAVAFNRDGGNDQALGIGADAIKYKVANFREGGLPDDGNFVLFLRNRNDRLKSREGVIDLIGWSDKLADDSIHTKVWPLRVFGTPDARNKIELERVHRRQHRIDPDKNTHGDDKDEHQALRDVGYTGIGYKRHAQNIAANGGTPGHEDTRKNLVADITATGVLTISEIMFAQGDGQYPQWIEIYNSSTTQPVNLHSEAGWRLLIENFDDGEIPVNRLSGTLNFKNSEVQTILPQQTVVVASTRARNSGSAFFDTRVVFPDTRVFSVWSDQRDELGMKRSTDPILSETGFYIELIDGKGNFSDGVGNLVKSPNRRAAQDIVWELSVVSGEMAEDGRSSILRRYREYKDGKLVGTYTAAEVEDMGVEADGWIAAYMTDFRDVRQTWYGHPDDYGSPGITGGRVLPVELSKFRPERLDDGTIAIRWITQSELNNAGFNILRSETAEGEFKQINTKLIAGHGTTSERHAYTYTDTSAKPNVVYYYQIQDVSLDGKVQTLRMSRLKGNVTPAGKATTTWGELKALQ